MQGIQIQKDSKQDKEALDKTSHTPWSIRGISQDVRAGASSRAKKSGITIGEWLELAIREKIKNDRNSEKSIVAMKTGKQSMDMHSVNNFIDLITKIKNAEISIPDRLSVQISAMLNKMAGDIRKGTITASSHDESLPSD